MGINLNKATGRYLSAADVEEGAIRAPIDHLEMAEFKNKKGEMEDKVVVYLAGEKKGFVLNKTNTLILKDAFGAEEEQLVGKVIELKYGKCMHAGSYFGKPAIQLVIPEAV